MKTSYIDDELLRAFKEHKQGATFEDSVFNREQAEMWVRLAVADQRVAEAIYRLCSECLQRKPTELNTTEPSVLTQELKQAFALHYIRALGARQLLNEVVNRFIWSIHHQGQYTGDHWFKTLNPLHNSSSTLEAKPTWKQKLELREQQRDGVSHFPTLASLFSAPTLAETALQLVHELALSIDPVRDQLIQVVHAQLSLMKTADSDPRLEAALSNWLWSQWRDEGQSEAMVLIAYQSVLDQPQRAQTLAVRLALISPQFAVAVCHELNRLPEPQKREFAQHLEKQMKRVGQIKLWVSCRKALYPH